MIDCDSCGLPTTPDKLMPIVSELKKHYFCINCLKQSDKLLSMKIAPNKEERKLLKQIRKFLKKSKN